MAIHKGAEIIAEYLIGEGMPYLFGVCGHGNIGLLDALAERRDRIATVSVHHESVAGFMADAYFRVTHRPVATFTSCGPGTANLPVALASALMDSSAVLAITGNVPTSQFNRGPFQETGRHFQADSTSMLRPVVKRSFQATRPEQLPLMLRLAYAEAVTGRPGPVQLDVPLNVFVETTEAEVPAPGGWRDGATPDAASAEVIESVLDLLASAERPVLVAGHGIELADAAAELAAVAERLRLPVANSPGGKGAFDQRSPLALGETGRNGTYMANRATREADLVVAFGTGFDDRSTSAWLPGYTYAIPPTKLVQVDIDPSEIGRNYEPTLAIVANARAVLAQLDAAALARAQEPSAAHRVWLGRIDEWRSRWREHVEDARGSEAVPIHPARVVADLRRVLPEDGILIADVGVHHNWLVQEWPAYRPRTVLQSWGYASMGFGVAGVLGAKLAAPDRPVVAVVGDGGFLMFPSVVATAVEYGIPAVWLVWNNRGYVSIREQQLGFFGREFVTSFATSDGELYSPDFAAMARSMGADGTKVSKPGDLGPAVEHALASGRPTVVDVRVDRDLGPPGTGSWELPPLPHPEPSFGWED